MKKPVSKFRQLMTEMPGHVRNEAPGHLGVFLDKLKEDWMEMADKGDPSIEASGTWEYEVDKAIEVLEDKMTEITDEVENNLQQGMYQGKFTPRS